MTLIDEINLRLAELQAMASYSSEDYERDKLLPNANIYDADFEDDDFAWEE